MKKMYPIIEARNVSFFLNKEKILEDINFSIHRGDYIGLVGPNGAGKSTLLKILLGIFKPSKGEIFYENKEASQSFNRHNIGYVAQRISQSEWAFPTTVEEVVASGRFILKKPFERLDSKDRKIIQSVMEKTGINRLKSMLISQLSGGQKQRVFVAKALVHEPTLLLLDEPTTGIDREGEESFYEFLKKLHTQQNLTILLVSHELDIITKEAQSVLCLNKKLICHVTPENFIKHDYLKILYGEQMKFIHHAHG